MPNFLIVLPTDFAEYEWEVETKGWFSECSMIFAGRSYRLNFYDAVRLRQEIEISHERHRAFFEPNLIVVRSVTRSEMERALDELLRNGLASSLTPEPLSTQARPGDSNEKPSSA